MILDLVGIKAWCERERGRPGWMAPDVEEGRDGLRFALSVIPDLVARVEELEAALKPFATVAPSMLTANAYGRAELVLTKSARAIPTTLEVVS